MEDVEVGGLADDAGGEGAVLEDGVGIAVAGTEEEAAALEAQRETAEVEGARGRVIAAGDVERVGGDIGEQRVGRRGADAELDVIRARRVTPQASAGVAREALVAETADAIGAVGSPLAIDDGPRADDVVRVRQAGRDDEVIAAELAEVAEVIEPKRGAGTDGAREARHREHGRADVVVRPVRVNLVEARSQGHGAEGLGVVDDPARLELDIRGIERDRGGIVDAVGHEGVGPVEEVERALVDRDRRRRREAAGILKIEFTSGDEGGAGIVVDALEVPVARAGLVDEDVTGDRAAEARVRGGGDRRLIGRGVADRAAEKFGLAATVGAVERGDELSAAIQVERGASVDREVVAREQRVGRVGHQVDRTAVDHEHPLRELLAIEVQRARQGLVERARAHEPAVDLERLARGDMQVGFSPGEADDRDGQASSGAGAVDEDAAGGDGERGRVEAGKSAEVDRTGDAAGQRQGVDRLVARQRVRGVKLGLEGRIGRGREDVGRDAVAGEGLQAEGVRGEAGGIIGGELVAVRRDARQQPVGRRDRAAGQGRGRGEEDLVRGRTESAREVERRAAVLRERGEGDGQAAAGGEIERAAAIAQVEDAGGGLGRAGRGRNEVHRAAEDLQRLVAEAIRGVGDGIIERQDGVLIDVQARRAAGRGRALEDRRATEQLQRAVGHRIRGGESQRARGILAEFGGADGGVDVIEHAREGDIARSVDLEEGVAVRVAAGVVELDVTERQRGAGKRAHAEELVDVVRTGTGEGQDEVGGQDVRAGDRLDRAHGVDAADLGPIARAREDDRLGDGDAALELEHRGLVVHLDHAGRDGDGTGRAGGGGLADDEARGVGDRRDEGADRDVRGRDHHARGEPRGVAAGDGGGRGRGDGQGGGHSRRGAERGSQAGLHDAAGDDETAAPRGVGGIKEERTLVLLAQGGELAGGGVKVEGVVELQGLAADDFDLTDVRGVGEAEGVRAGEGQVGGGAEGRSARRRIEDDEVGGIAELAVGRDGEDALGDVDIAREGVRAGEHERARADLIEAGAGQDAGELEPLGDVGKGGRGDVESRGAGQRDGVGSLESVTVVVGQGEAEVEVRDARRGEHLVRGLRIRDRAARAADGEVRGDAGVEDHVAERQGLGRHGAVAIAQQRQGRREAEGGGVEVAGVAGRVEDEAAEAGAVEARDARDVRDLAEQRDRQPGAVDLDRGRARGEAVERAVQRQGAHRAAAGVIEDGRAREGQRIADGAVGIIDEERGARGHGDTRAAERAAGEADATLGGRAVGAEDDTAALDGEAAGELVGAGKLEQTGPGLDDGDVHAGQDRGDVEGREDVRVGSRGAREHQGADRDRVGAGGEDHATCVERRDDHRVVGSRGDRRQAGEGQDAARADAEVGEPAAAGFAADIIEGDGLQRVREVIRILQAAGAVDDHVGVRVDRTGHVGVDRREVIAAEAAVDRERAGRQDGRARDGRIEVQRALVDRRAAGEGVDGGEVEDARAGLDQADGVAEAIVRDDRVDDDVAEADREGDAAGGGRGGGLAQRELGETVDGKDIGAGRDTRAGDRHARDDAQSVAGAGDRDDGRTGSRRTVAEGAARDGLAGVGRQRVGAQRDLVIPVDGEDLDAGGGEVAAARDGHARRQADRGQAGDDRGARRESGAAPARKAGGRMIDDELARAGGSRPAGGQHATRGDGADAGGEPGVIAAEQAAELEIEDRVRGRETDVIDRTAGQAEHRRARVGRQGQRRVRLDRDLRQLARTEVGVIADEATRADRAEAQAGVVGQVIGRARDRPGAKEPATEGRRGRREVKVRGVARQALGITRDVEGRARRARQRGDGEVGGPEGAAGVRERDVVVPLGDRQRADRLGRGLIGEPLDRQAAAAQRDRRRVVQAVVVLDAEVAVVVDRQRGVVQRDRRRVRQRAVVAEGQRAAGEGGRAAEGLGAAELERVAADAGEAQVGAGDGAHERLVGAVHVRHEVRRRGAGVRDRAAGAGGGAEGDQAADELRRAVEVERAVRLDVEEIGAAGPEGVVTRAELERAAKDGRLAAVILLTGDRERAGALLREVGIGDHRAREVKRRRRVDGHEGRGVGRGRDGAGGGRVAADRERGAVRDAGDEGVARDARAADHLADREAGGAGDRDRRRSVRRGDARRRDEVQAGNRERVRDAAGGEDGAG